VSDQAQRLPQRHGLARGGPRKPAPGCQPTPPAWRLIDWLFIQSALAWGNWALYYWIAVLGFNASFHGLQSGLPLLLLQFAASAWLVRRWKLPDAGCDPANRWPADSSAARPASAGGIARRVALVAGAMGLLAGIAGLLWGQGISSSPLGYNLLWAISMPPFLAAVAAWPGQPTADGGGNRRMIVTARGAGLDLAVLTVVCAVGLWAASHYGYPSPDDAFYANVISATLADPQLPVQGQDLLLGTSMPYTIHPGYRVSGFEMLAALVADLAGCDPLWVYYDVLPAAGVLFWAVAAHVFLRSLGLPCPALGVGAATALLMVWLAGKSPGIWFSNLHFGKGYLAVIGAPLIFGSVAAFARQRDFATWLVTLLAFSGVLGWSSTAMFVAPVSLALAAAVYLPSSWRSARSTAALAAVLVPAAGLIATTSRVAAIAPPALAAGTGEILVSGESLGGIGTQTLLFLTLLALPLLARAVGGLRQAELLRRLGVVGGLSVFAPYWIEAVATRGGLSLLSWRMWWAFPTSLLAGALACLLLGLPLAGRPATVTARALAWTLPAFAAWIFVWLHSFTPLWPLRQTFSVRVERARYVESLVEDARQIRELLPEEGLMAAGYVNEFLPILPRPPQMAAVRFYLKFHRHGLSEEEYNRRTSLDRVLVDLTPDAGRDVEATVAEAVENIRRLGVVAVVFATTPEAAAAARWPYGRHRQPLGRSDLIEALTRSLSEAGFECREIPSGHARVCRLPAIGSRREPHAPASIHSGSRRTRPSRSTQTTVVEPVTMIRSPRITS
jgi:hypothetical protein